MVIITVIPKTIPMDLLRYDGHNEAEIQEFTGLETKKAEAQNGSPIAFMFHDAGPRLAQQGEYVNKYGMAFTETTLRNGYQIVDTEDAEEIS